jgi:hypothetical protein
MVATHGEGFRQNPPREVDGLSPVSSIRTAPIRNGVRKRARGWTAPCRGTEEWGAYTVDETALRHGAVRKRRLGVVCCGDRVGRARERDEERISLRVYLDTFVTWNASRNSNRCSASTTA